MGYLWFRIRLWFREQPEKLAWWVACRIPRKVEYLAFIRVYAAGVDAPGPEFQQVCNHWEKAHVD